MEESRLNTNKKQDKIKKYLELLQNLWILNQRLE